MVLCQTIKYLRFQIFICYFVILFSGIDHWKEMMWLITDFLPKPQVKAPQFTLHISYLLQKCKKGKPDEMDLPF